MDSQPSKSNVPFRLLEATIGDIHSAYQSGQLTAHQLVQMYLDRIETHDKKGPAINAIITLNSKALEEADQLDATFALGTAELRSPASLSGPIQRRT